MRHLVSILFLWLAGDDTFELKPLPRLARFSPSFLPYKLNSDHIRMVDTQSLLPREDYGRYYRQGLNKNKLSRLKAEDPMHIRHLALHYRAS